MSRVSPVPTSRHPNLATPPSLGGSATTAAPFRAVTWGRIDVGPGPLRRRRRPEGAARRLPRRRGAEDLLERRDASATFADDRDQRIRKEASDCGGGLEVFESH